MMPQRQQQREELPELPDDDKGAKAAVHISKLESRRVLQNILVWLVIFGSVVTIFLIPAFVRDFPEDRVANHEGLLLAKANMRDLTKLQWHVVPLTVVVMVQYFGMLGDRDFDGLFGSLGVILFDWLNELWNAVFYTKTRYAAPWMATWGGGSLQITVGWNIEIIISFMLAGVASISLIRKVGRLECYLGINNRHFWSFFCAAIHLGVEVVLNMGDRLLWSYWWWNRTSVIGLFLPFVVGYLPFYELAYFLYDSPRSQQVVIVVSMVVLLTVATVVCAQMNLI